MDRLRPTRPDPRELRSPRANRIAALLLCVGLLIAILALALFA